MITFFRSNTATFDNRTEVPTHLNMPITVRDDISASSFEDLDCPLCAEHFEFDEINFFPCKCGYQVCKFCFDRISNDSDVTQRICPACRSSYSDKPVVHKPITAKLKSKLLNFSKNINKPSRIPNTKNNLLKSQKSEPKPDPAQLTIERQHLQGLRVLQKNLVFVGSGLTGGTANEEKLIQQKLKKVFEQFGTVKKIVITQPNRDLPEYIQAYLTFQSSESALKAILFKNESPWEGRLLRCSLGTTKYCSRFLRGLECTNTECMYLHELGSAEQSFDQVEMNEKKHKEYENYLLDEFQEREELRHDKMVCEENWRNENNVGKNQKISKAVKDAKKVKTQTAQVQTVKNQNLKGSTASRNQWNVIKPKVIEKSPEKILKSAKNTNLGPSFEKSEMDQTPNAWGMVNEKKISSRTNEESFLSKQQRNTKRTKDTKKPGKTAKLDTNNNHVFFGEEGPYVLNTERALGDKSAPIYQEPTYEELYPEKIYLQPVYKHQIYQEPIDHQQIYQQPIDQQPIHQKPIHQEPIHQEITIPASTFNYPPGIPYLHNKIKNEIINEEHKIETVNNYHVQSWCDAWNNRHRGETNDIDKTKAQQLNLRYNHINENNGAQEDEAWKKIVDLLQVNEKNKKSDFFLKIEKNVTDSGGAGDNQLASTILNQQEFDSTFEIKNDFFVTDECFSNEYYFSNDDVSKNSYFLSQNDSIFDVVEPVVRRRFTKLSKIHEAKMKSDNNFLKCSEKM